AGRLAMQSAAIETSWDIAQVSLPHDVDVVLGWAVREAITNVIRHSRARQCSVVVSAGLVEAAAEVIDDGVGLPGGQPPGALANGSERKQPGGNGLTGLGERVSALHGRLDAGPRPEGGFRLRASIPMTPPQARVAT